MDAKVLGFKNGKVTVEVDGKKYEGEINELVHPDDIEHIKKVFRRGKIAWVTRRLRKMI
jgi:hypothetical protein